MMVSSRKIFDQLQEFKKSQQIKPMVLGEYPPLNVRRSESQAKFEPYDDLKDFKLPQIAQKLRLDNINRHSM